MVRAEGAGAGQWEGLGPGSGDLGRPRESEWEGSLGNGGRGAGPWQGADLALGGSCADLDRVHPFISEFKYCWENFVHNQGKPFMCWENVHRNSQSMSRELNEILR